MVKRQMDFAAAPQMMMGVAMQAKDNVMGAMQNGSNPMEAMAEEAGSMAGMASSFMGSMGAWVCQENHKSMMNSVGMRYLRTVLGKTRIARVSNEWVLKECGLKGIQ
ncbi:unnamed protein product [Timema podura]|uniref:Uncharacterized protein n=1 Tax=Timema podura TaxID=61482 RepID=A0ABN7PBJ6_TIMPD|nr:unnamed protein product [Timema podura]